MDKRIIRTKNSIKKSLIKILNKKRLDAVTITEVCELSNIQRSTFYGNYQNVSDCFQEIVDDVVLTMEKEIEKNKVKSIEEFYRTYFEVVLKNKDIFKAVHNTSIDNPLIKSLVEVSCGLFGKSEFYENKLVMNYHLSGFYSFAKGWLDSGCKESIDELLDMLAHIHKNDFKK